MIEVFIHVMVDKNVVDYVPPQARRRLEVELVPVLLALTIPTSLPGLEMRKCSGSCKSNTVSTLLRKNEEATTRIQGTKDIPLKPPNKTVELIAKVHSINY